MREYTQSELDELIACPKQIMEAPRREMRLEGSQRRNDMGLRSTVGDREFRVFMRMHDEFSENFSIGLAYNPKDGTGEIILLRCNGPPGAYNSNFDPLHPHAEFHVHRASEDAIRSGYRAERRAQRTQDFASYREALTYFLRETNIVSAGEHFPDHVQPMLPFSDEEPAL